MINKDLNNQINQIMKGVNTMNNQEVKVTNNEKKEDVKMNNNNVVGISINDRIAAVRESMRTSSKNFVNYSGATNVPVDMRHVWPSINWDKEKGLFESKLRELIGEVKVSKKGYENIKIVQFNMNGPKSEDIVIGRTTSNKEVTGSLVGTTLHWLFKMIKDGHDVAEHFVTMADFASQDQYNYFVDYGIKYNGKQFVFLGAGSSYQRAGGALFTDLNPWLVRAYMTLFSEDFREGKETKIPNMETRVFQSLSSGVLLGGAVEIGSEDLYPECEVSYVVIPDMEDGSNDGSSSMNTALRRFIEKCMHIKHAGWAQIRLAKGATMQMPENYFEELAAKYGIKYDPTRPTIFVTKSMWKYEPGFKFHPFVVLRPSEEISKFRCANYQLLNNIASGTKRGLEILNELLNEHYNMLDCQTPEDLVKAFGAFGEGQEMYTAMAKIVQANPDLAANYPAIRKAANRLFQKKLRDSGRGRILINGSMMNIAIDQYAFLGKPSLKAGEYLYLGNDIEKIKDILCTIQRTPNANPHEVQTIHVVGIKEHPEYAHLAGCNILIFNVFDKLWEKLQGADFDGDEVLFIRDPRIAELVMSDVWPAPELSVKGKPDPRIINKDNIIAYHKRTWGINSGNRESGIGHTSNLVSAEMDQAQMLGEVEIMLSRVLIINPFAPMIGSIIDSVKDGTTPDPSSLVRTTDKMPHWLAPNPSSYDKNKFYHSTSTIGKICDRVQGMVEEFLKNHTNEQTNTVSFTHLVDKLHYADVLSEVKTIKRKYSGEIASMFNNMKAPSNKEEERQRSKMLGVVIEKYSDMLMELAAEYDVLSVAAAAIEIGQDSSFAFCCFTEGVVALFSADDRYVIVPAERVKKNDIVLEIVEENGVSFARIFREASAEQLSGVQNALDLNYKGGIVLDVTGIKYHAAKTFEELMNILSVTRDANIQEIKLEGTSNPMNCLVVNGQIIGVVNSRQRSSSDDAISRARTLALTGYPLTITNARTRVNKAGELSFYEITVKVNNRNDLESATDIKEAATDIVDEGNTTYNFFGGADETASSSFDPNMESLIDSMLDMPEMGDSSFNFYEAPTTPVVDQTKVKTERNFNIKKTVTSTTSPYNNNEKMVIYTDGACRGNGKANNVGGFGIVMQYIKNNEVVVTKEHKFSCQNTTNNCMELTAVVEALSKITRPMHVELYTDSAYVVNSINQEWVCKWEDNGWVNSEKKPVANKALWEKYLDLGALHSVKMIKVKGHSDNDMNNRCDELANIAMDEFSKEQA